MKAKKVQTNARIIGLVGLLALAVVLSPTATALDTYGGPPKGTCVGWTNAGENTDCWGAYLKDNGRKCVGQSHDDVNDTRDDCTGVHL